MGRKTFRQIPSGTANVKMSKASCFVRWFDATANNASRLRPMLRSTCRGDFQMPSSPKAAQLEAMADLIVLGFTRRSGRAVNTTRRKLTWRTPALKGYFKKRPS